jgi:putative oxidoreductase
MRDAQLLAGRILLASFFLFVGLNKLLHVQSVASEWTSAWPLLGGPMFVVIVGVIELSCAVAIVIGFRLRLAAYILAAFCFCTIPVYHDFWNLTGEARFTQLFMVFLYLSAAGGYITLAAAGPGRHSIDKA